MMKKILLPFVTAVLAVIIVVASLANHQQNENIQQVLAQNLDGRLIPHKANYRNKLNNILSDKLRSFEFDALFNDTAPMPFFEIGHDTDEANGTSFEDYLIISKDKQITKIWMDLKNVSESNITGILARLDYLDKKYRIKNILVFESDSISPMLRRISNAGYHTSYYLPKTILKTMVEKDTPALRQEALRIKTLVEAQNLAAISFRLDLYPFVKSYIEKLIPEKIVYHTWGKHQLKQKNVLSNMQSADFYQDERIKTIIYSYYNNKLNRLLFSR